MRKLLLGALLLAGSVPWGHAASENLQSVKVRPGDTLWSLSQRWLKNPRRWNVILRFNKLPTSDPTVALPGMTLFIPKTEIKANLRAATLVHKKSNVVFRKKNTPSWKSAQTKMQLYDGDALRTRKKSWARVKFFGGSVLSLDPDSMAILKAPRPDNRYIVLKRGALHATVARVVTPSARVIPVGKDTKYTARILDDLSTRVQVFKGKADVQDTKGKKTVRVNAGQYTEVKIDKMPTTPVRIPNIELAAQTELSDLGTGVGESVVRVRRGGGAPRGSIAAELEALSVGVPVAAYAVQVARKRSDFRRAKPRLVFDKEFDAYEPIDLKQANLRDGQYWVRVAIVDLLGDKGKWSALKSYRTGEEEQFQTLSFQGVLEILRPDEEFIEVRVPRYRITGRVGIGLNVLINGERVRADEDGYWSKEVFLKKGRNGFRIEASDVRGNDKIVIRNINYRL
ncbi:MAG: hypothetical protein COB53_11165 [Elusimicrobia bacterium]|nr:MAG: hypothetical protein COB53_11165 [Elusimicrobiota bacterium]